MKITSLKILIISLLLTSAVTIKSVTPQELSKEQTAGIAYIVKLYGPLKQKLALIDKQITNIEEKVTNAVNLFATHPQESKETIKKSLQKKLNKISTIREKLLSLRQAIQHCPLTLKTERIQQAIDKAGMTYLGNLRPSGLEKRVNELQATIENLLEILRS